MPPENPLEFETPRLRMRQFRASDLDDYAACVGDPEVMKYIGEGRPMAREDAWRSMAMMSGHWNLRGYGLWAVEEKATSRLVGRVGYFYPEGWPGEEIGWLLGRSAWGRGYATEAATAALLRGRALLGLERVIALIQPENAPSIRLALRLGGSLDRRIEFHGRPVDVYAVPLPPQETPRR